MLDYFSHQKAEDYDRYSLEDFTFRWKKLQRVLVKEGVDSLLLVTGLDANDSEPSAYLFNWLFLGLSGKPIILNKYLDSAFNEMVVAFCHIKWPNDIIGDKPVCIETSDIMNLICFKVINIIFIISFVSLYRD